MALLEMLVQKWLFCCHVAYGLCTYRFEAFISAASRMVFFFVFFSPLLALLDVALAAQQ